jgi:hypothetical protein
LVENKLSSTSSCKINFVFKPICWNLSKYYIANSVHCCVQSFWPLLQGR